MKSLIIALAAMAFTFAANAAPSKACTDCCKDKCAECCKGKCGSCCK